MFENLKKLWTPDTEPKRPTGLSRRHFLQALGITTTTVAMGGMVGSLWKPQRAAGGPAATEWPYVPELLGWPDRDAFLGDYAAQDLLRTQALMESYREMPEMMRSHDAVIMDVGVPEQLSYSLSPLDELDAAALQLFQVGGLMQLLEKADMRILPPAEALASKLNLQFDYTLPSGKKVDTREVIQRAEQISERYPDVFDIETAARQVGAFNFWLGPDSPGAGAFGVKNVMDYEGPDMLTAAGTVVCKKLG